MSTPTSALLRECAASIAPKTRPGLDNLREVCPNLEQALSDAQLAGQLGDNWQRRIGTRGLNDLIWLMERYQAAPASDAPNPSSLAPVLSALRLPHAASITWWEKFKDWLRSLLQPKQATDSTWLERLLSGIESIPRQVMRITWYAALAVVVGLAGWLVWRELKLAGVFERWRTPGASRKPSPAVGELASLSATNWTLSDDLDKAPLRDRPVLLLRLLVRALVSSGRLRGERSLTHSELTRRGQFDNAEQLRRFARIASLAEHRLYGSADAVGTPAAADDASLLQDGRELYAQLLSAASATALSSTTGGRL
jgi:hypothetical protein